jgi:hypothetical protein
MGQNKSLFASFFVILGLIAFGVVIGILVPRVSLVDAGSSPSDAPANYTPDTFYTFSLCSRMTEI